MRVIILIILLAFCAQTQAKELQASHNSDVQDSRDKVIGKFIDKLVDKLVDKAFKALPIHHIDLQNVLAKTRWPQPSFPRPLFRVPHSPFPILNFPVSIPCSPFTVHRTQPISRAHPSYEREEWATNLRRPKQRSFAAGQTLLPQLSKSEQLQEQLKMVRKNPNITLPRAPNFRKSFIDDRDGSKVPLILRPYQKQMIMHLMVMKRFVVGDDCGLGKTIESIAALCQLWSKKPNMKAVVLTRKSSIRQWEREFSKFTKDIQVLVATGTATKRGKVHALWEKATDPTVLIQGYTSSVHDFGRLQYWEGYSLILDDVTVVKTTTTQVHQACSHFALQASRCWGLTATLIKNNLVEGYGVYKVIVPDLFPVSVDTFMLDYCITEKQKLAYGKERTVITGYRQSDIERFRNEIDAHFLGRPKHAVAKDLPALTTRTVSVGLTGFQSQKYLAALEGLLELNGGDNVERKKTTALSSVVYCQEIVNHPALIGYPDEKSEKLDALVDMLTVGGDLYDDKVIVFSRFKQMVKTAMPVLTEAGIQCVRVTGDEDVGERQKAMDAFQNPKDPTRVIFITMAGGDSINLQAAKAIVFYDMPWSAGDYLQIVGRMIRIGAAHDKCYAIHLVCERTIDERVQEVVSKKMVLIEQVLGKRLKKTKGEDKVFKAGSELGVLFDGLVADAKKRRRKEEKKRLG